MSMRLPLELRILAKDFFEIFGFLDLMSSQFMVHAAVSARVSYLCLRIFYDVYAGIQGSPRNAFGYLVSPGVVW